MDDDTKEKAKIILFWLGVIAIIIGLGMLAQYVLVLYPPPHAVHVGKSVVSFNATYVLK